MTYVVSGPPILDGHHACQGAGSSSHVVRAFPSCLSHVPVKAAGDSVTHLLLLLHTGVPVEGSSYPELC